MRREEEPYSYTWEMFRTRNQRILAGPEVAEELHRACQARKLLLDTKLTAQLDGAACTLTGVRWLDLNRVLEVYADRDPADLLAVMADLSGRSDITATQAVQMMRERLLAATRVDPFDMPQVAEGEV